MGPVRQCRRIADRLSTPQPAGGRTTACVSAERFESRQRYPELSWTPKRAQLRSGSRTAVSERQQAGVCMQDLHASFEVGRQGRPHGPVPDRLSGLEVRAMASTSPQRGGACVDRAGTTPGPPKAGKRQSRGVSFPRTTSARPGKPWTRIRNPRPPTAARVGTSLAEGGLHVPSNSDP